MATATLMPPELLSPSAALPGEERKSQMLPAQGIGPNLFPIPVEVIEANRSAVPDEFLFAAFRHPSLVLREAIPLRTERSAEGVSVIWDSVEEFGFGETFGAAVDDFSHTIGELYVRLHSDSEVFAEELLDVRRKLDEFIEPRKR